MLKIKTKKTMESIEQLFKKRSLTINAHIGYFAEIITQTNDGIAINITSVVLPWITSMIYLIPPDLDESLCFKKDFELFRLLYGATWNKVRLEVDLKDFVILNEKFAIPIESDEKSSYKSKTKKENKITELTVQQLVKFVESTCLKQIVKDGRSWWKQKLSKTINNDFAPPDERNGKNEGVDKEANEKKEDKGKCPINFIEEEKIILPKRIRSMPQLVDWRKDKEEKEKAILKEKIKSVLPCAVVLDDINRNIYDSKNLKDNVEEKKENVNSKLSYSVEQLLSLAPNDQRVQLTKVLQKDSGKNEQLQGEGYEKNMLPTNDTFLDHEKCQDVLNPINCSKDPISLNHSTVSKTDDNCPPLIAPLIRQPSLRMQQLLKDQSLQSLDMDKKNTGSSNEKDAKNAIISKPDEQNSILDDKLAKTANEPTLKSTGKESEATKYGTSSPPPMLHPKYRLQQQIKDQTQILNNKDKNAPTELTQKPGKSVDEDGKYVKIKPKNLDVMYQKVLNCQFQNDIQRKKCDNQVAPIDIKHHHVHTPDTNETKTVQQQNQSIQNFTQVIDKSTLDKSVNNSAKLTNRLNLYSQNLTHITGNPPNLASDKKEFFNQDVFRSYTQISERSQSNSFIQPIGLIDEQKATLRSLQHEVRVPAYQKPYSIVPPTQKATMQQDKKQSGAIAMNDSLHQKNQEKFQPDQISLQEKEKDKRNNAEAKKTPYQQIHPKQQICPKISQQADNQDIIFPERNQPVQHHSENLTDVYHYHDFPRTATSCSESVHTLQNNQKSSQNVQIAPKVSQKSEVGQNSQNIRGTVKNIPSQQIIHSAPAQINAIDLKIEQPIKNSLPGQINQESIEYKLNCQENDRKTVTNSTNIVANSNSQLEFATNTTNVSTNHPKIGLVHPRFRHLLNIRSITNSQIDFVSSKDTEIKLGQVGLNNATKVENRNVYESDTSKINNDLSHITTNSCFDGDGNMIVTAHPRYKFLKNMNLGQTALNVCEKEKPSTQKQACIEQGEMKSDKNLTNNEAFDAAHQNVEVKETKKVIVAENVGSQNKVSITNVKNTPNGQLSDDLKDFFNRVEFNEIGEKTEQRTKGITKPLLKNSTCNIKLIDPNEALPKKRKRNVIKHSANRKIKPLDDLLGKLEAKEEVNEKLDNNKTSDSDLEEKNPNIIYSISDMPKLFTFIRENDQARKMTLIDLESEKKRLLNEYEVKVKHFRGLKHRFNNRKIKDDEVNKRKQKESKEEKSQKNKGKSNDDVAKSSNNQINDGEAMAQTGKQSEPNKDDSKPSGKQNVLLDKLMAGLKKFEKELVDRNKRQLELLQQNLYQKLWKNIEICNVCDKYGKLVLCGNCLNVSYCSNECKSSHWTKTHSKTNTDKNNDISMKKEKKKKKKKDSCNVGTMKVEL